MDDATRENSLSAIGKSARDSLLLVRGTFTSLRHRKFALFFWSQMASATGEWVQITAVNILILRLFGGGRELAFANLSAFVPLILITPLAGVMADARNKVRILAVANVGLAAASITFGALTQAHGLSLPLIYLLNAAGGSLAAFDFTARQAIVGDLVPLESLANGVGLNVTSLTVARALGPLGAAALIPLIGLQGAFYANAATYLAILAALPWLRMARNDTARQFLPRTNLFTGMVTIWQNRPMRVPLLQIALLSGFGITSTLLLPLFVVRSLHAPGGTYAVLAGIVGAGSVIGGLTTAARSVTGHRPVTFCALGLAVALAIVGVSPSPLAAALPLLASGILAACALATALATMQVAAPPQLRGAVIGAYTAVFTAATGLVSPTTGFIADLTSPRAAYLICAFVVAASAALMMAPRPDAQEAPAAADLRAAGGPQR